MLAQAQAARVDEIHDVRRQSAVTQNTAVSRDGKSSLNGGVAGQLSTGQAEKRKRTVDEKTKETMKRFQPQKNRKLKRIRSGRSTDKKSSDGSRSRYSNDSNAMGRKNTTSSQGSRLS